MKTNTRESIFVIFVVHMNFVLVFFHFLISLLPSLFSSLRFLLRDRYTGISWRPSAVAVAVLLPSVDD